MYSNSKNKKDVLYSCGLRHGERQKRPQLIAGSRAFQYHLTQNHKEDMPNFQTVWNYVQCIKQIESGKKTRCEHDPNCKSMIYTLGFYPKEVTV